MPLLHLESVAITFCILIRNVHKVAQAGSKLKIIIKAFLRTLPLRISPSSQETFSSSVNLLMSGPPLRLSARWLRCRPCTLLSKKCAQYGLYLLTKPALLTYSKDLSIFVYQKCEKLFITGITRAATMWFLIMMIAVLCSPVFKEHWHV